MATYSIYTFASERWNSVRSRITSTCFKTNLFLRRKRISKGNDYYYVDFFSSNIRIIISNWPIVGCNKNDIKITLLSYVLLDCLTLERVGAISHSLFHKSYQMLIALLLLNWFLLTDQNQMQINRFIVIASIAMLFSLFVSCVCISCCSLPQWLLDAYCWIYYYIRIKSINIQLQFPFKNCRGRHQLLVFSVWFPSQHKRLSILKNTECNL